MRLYTICINDRPTVTLSANADVPTPDSFLTDPAALKALRDSQAVMDEMRAKVPHLDSLTELSEIDGAIDTWLGEDLLDLTHDGQPLWTGNRDDLAIREARVDEAERWHISRREALSSGEIEAGEESWLLFLVTVTYLLGDEP